MKSMEQKAGVQPWFLTELWFPYLGKRRLANLLGFYVWGHAAVSSAGHLLPCGSLKTEPPSLLPTRPQNRLLRFGAGRGSSAYGMCTKLKK